jgi:hypothetical protein
LIDLIISLSDSEKNCEKDDKAESANVTQEELDRIPFQKSKDETDFCILTLSRLCENNIVYCLLCGTKRAVLNNSSSDEKL